MSAETWRPVPGWEEFYEVSDFGRVRSLTLPGRKGGLRSISYNSRGYAQVGLCANGKRVTAKVHTLVMLAFVGPRPDGLVVCHFDDDKANNRLTNLRYDTTKANVADLVRNGRHPRISKTHCKYGHELAGDNITRRVDSDGWVHRECRECRTRKEIERASRHNAQRRAKREAQRASAA